METPNDQAEPLPPDSAALDVLWGRMEAAETDMDWLCVKAQDGEELELGGRIYKPSNDKLTDRREKNQ